MRAQICNTAVRADNLVDLRTGMSSLPSLSGLHLSHVATGPDAAHPKNVRQPPIYNVLKDSDALYYLSKYMIQEDHVVAALSLIRTNKCTRDLALAIDGCGCLTHTSDGKKTLLGDTLDQLSIEELYWDSPYRNLYNYLLYSADLWLWFSAYYISKDIEVIDDITSFTDLNTQWEHPGPVRQEYKDEDRFLNLLVDKRISLHLRDRVKDMIFSSIVASSHSLWSLVVTDKSRCSEKLGAAILLASKLTRVAINLHPRDIESDPIPDTNDLPKIEAMFSAASSADNTHLKKLHVKGVKVEGKLSVLVSKSLSLETLTLELCRLEPSFFDSLVEILRNGSIKLSTLVLQHCWLGDDHAQKIADAMSSNVHLSYLGLARNRITNHGARNLVRAACGKEVNLGILDLRFNAISAFDAHLTEEEVKSKCLERSRESQKGVLTIFIKGKQSIIPNQGRYLQWRQDHEKHELLTYEMPGDRD